MESTKVSFKKISCDVWAGSYKGVEYKIERCIGWTPEPTYYVYKNGMTLIAVDKLAKAKKFVNGWVM